MIKEKYFELSFRPIFKLWYFCDPVNLILNWDRWWGGGVAINYYSNYTDVSRAQQEFRSEWGRERDGFYKAKSCLIGKNLWAVRPGFGSETRARWANDCLHNSPQWCFSVVGRRLLKLLFLQSYSPSCVVWACVWQQRRHVDEKLRLRAPNSSLHGSIRLQSQLIR